MLRNDNTGILVKTSYVGSIAISLLATYSGMMSHPGSEAVMVAALMLIGVFVLTSLFEVHSSTNIRSSEKTMWTIGLLFTGLIAGLAYLLMGRKRVLGSDDSRSHRFR